MSTYPPTTYAAYVTSSDLESRIEGCIGERDNSFKIVRSIKLNWFGNVKNTRYVGPTLAKYILQGGVQVKVVFFI